MAICAPLARLGPALGLLTERGDRVLVCYGSPSYGSLIAKTASSPPPRNEMSEKQPKKKKKVYIRGLQTDWWDYTRSQHIFYEITFNAIISSSSARKVKEKVSPVMPQRYLGDTVLLFIIYWNSRHNKGSCDPHHAWQSLFLATAEARWVPTYFYSWVTEATQAGFESLSPRDLVHWPLIRVLFIKILPHNKCMWRIAEHLKLD